MNVASMTAMATIHGFSGREMTADDGIAADGRTKLDPPASAVSCFDMFCLLLSFHLKIDAERNRC
jgi:hypothetical protein